MFKFFYFIIISFSLFGQDLNLSSISIESSSTVYAVADILYFSITISADDPDPLKVFEKHKLLEKKLINLFKEFSIPDSSIQYTLLTLRKTDRRADDKKFTSTQNVKVVFKGISKYQEFQVRLLSNGFYQFRAGFGSSKVEKARKDGYKAALKNARRDAKIIAETLGKKVGEILKISTKTNEFRQLNHSSASLTASVNSLIEIEQSVAARTNLKVTFELK